MHPNAVESGWELMAKTIAAMSTKATSKSAFATAENVDMQLISRPPSGSQNRSINAKRIE
jgi:hypothetical protein